MVHRWSTDRNIEEVGREEKDEDEAKLANPGTRSLAPAGARMCGSGMSRVEIGEMVDGRAGGHTEGRGGKITTKVVPMKHGGDGSGMES